MSVGFHKPAMVEAALALLAADPEARPLSGGQTLVPMMNLDLFRPSAIVSLNGIAELAGITTDATGAVRIGARASHAVLAASTLFKAGQSLIPLTAAQIAHPAVRQAGTIGGACAHGDPAADWPVALCAAGASIEIAGATGRRLVPAVDFFQHFLTTALEPGELVTAIIVPALPGRAIYRKFNRVDGDYATVSVAAIVELQGGVCRFARLAAGSVGPRPVRATAVEAALVGRPLDKAAADAAAAQLAALASPMSDVRGSAAYKQRILPRLISQTLLECAAP